MFQNSNEGRHQTNLLDADLHSSAVATAVCENEQQTQTTTCHPLFCEPQTSTSETRHCCRRSRAQGFTPVAHNEERARSNTPDDNYLVGCFCILTPTPKSSIDSSRRKAG